MDDATAERARGELAAIRDALASAMGRWRKGQPLNAADAGQLYAGVTARFLELKQIKGEADARSREREAAYADRLVQSQQQLDTVTAEVQYTRAAVGRCRREVPFSEAKLAVLSEAEYARRAPAPFRPTEGSSGHSQMLKRLLFEYNDRVALDNELKAMRTEKSTRQAKRASSTSTSTQLRKKLKRVRDAALDIANFITQDPAAVASAVQGAGPSQAARADAGLPGPLYVALHSARAAQLVGFDAGGLLKITGASVMANPATQLLGRIPASLDTRSPLYLHPKLVAINFSVRGKPFELVLGFLPKAGVAVAGLLLKEKDASTALTKIYSDGDGTRILLDACAQAENPKAALDNSGLLYARPSLLAYPWVQRLCALNTPGSEKDSGCAADGVFAPFSMETVLARICAKL